MIAALKAELAALESDLRADPRFRKMERVRELLRDYEPHAPQGSLFEGSAPPAPKERLRVLPLPSGRQLTKLERVKIGIRGLLKTKGTAHRKEILAHLIADGVMGHEKNPMASLAAYLSGFKDELEFDGDGNYSLREDAAA